MKTRKQIKTIWENTYQTAPLSKVNYFAKRTMKLIKGKNYKNILDLGSGNGVDSFYFVKKGYEVTAVDLSETALKALKTYAKQRNLTITTKCTDLRKLNFKQESFDVIYAHLSLHYFDDLTTTKIFNKLHNILKKDGMLFVKCKSSNDFLYGQGKKLSENFYEQEYPRHFFDNKYMRQKLIKFKNINIRKNSSFYHRKEKSSFIEAYAIK